MAEYTEAQRMQYWEAVSILKGLIEEGIDKEEMLEEIDSDI